MFVSSSQTSPLDSLHSWSSSALLVAQQYVREHLGRRSRTEAVPEISARVAALREQRCQFIHLLQLATSLATQLEHVMQTQRYLGDALNELSQSGGDVPLGEQFSSSSDTLKLVSKNGDTLLSMLLSLLNVRQYRFIDSTPHWNKVSHALSIGVVNHAHAHTVLTAIFQVNLG